MSGISERFLFGVTFVRHFFADELGVLGLQGVIQFVREVNCVRFETPCFRINALS